MSAILPGRYGLYEPETEHDACGVGFVAHILGERSRGIVEDALELAAYGLRTADVEVVRELDPDLPHVWGDSDQLHQVLTNLIVNAQQALVQAEPPRCLRLRTRRQGDEVEIEVADNGPGIAPEYHERIWGIFQRLEARDKVEGTGIGLSVVQKIVESRGGRAWVESAEGEGATFRFTWPKQPRPAG